MGECLLLSQLPHRGCKIVFAMMPSWSEGIRSEEADPSPGRAADFTRVKAVVQVTVCVWRGKREDEGGVRGSVAVMPGSSTTTSGSAGGRPRSANVPLDRLEWSSFE